MPGINKKEDNGTKNISLRLIRFFLVLLLGALAIAEGYYIFVLKDKIDKQTEEIKNVSIQLQQLKLERGSLSEELSSIKTPITGEKEDGDTDKR